MKSDIFFSIVIATYNSELTLDVCLNSIFSQNFKNFEIIVIDGGSKDSTLNYLRTINDERIRYITEKDNGVYDAMNKGICMSSGSWLYFMGSDDKFYDNKVLDNIYRFILETNCQVVYGNVYFSSQKKVYDGEFNKEKLLLKKMNICHQAIFYKRSVFSLAGDYNNDFKILADYDFNLRLFLKYNIEFQYTDLIIAFYNDLGLSFTTKDVLFEKYFIEEYIIKQYKFEEIFNFLVLCKRKNDNLMEKSEQEGAFIAFKKLFYYLKKGKF